MGAAFVVVGCVLVEAQDHAKVVVLSGKQRNPRLPPTAQVKTQAGREGGSRGFLGAWAWVVWGHSPGYFWSRGLPKLRRIAPASGVGAGGWFAGDAWNRPDFQRRK